MAEVEAETEVWRVALEGAVVVERADVAVPEVVAETADVAVLEVVAETADVAVPEVVAETAEVAVTAETDEVEAAVAGVLLEVVKADVPDVAVDNGLACGAASAAAAKSRTRAVGFILLECCMIEKRRT